MIDLTIYLSLHLNQACTTASIILNHLKKCMKKIIACLLFAGTFTLTAAAQAPIDKKAPMHPHRNGMVMKALNLSDAQKVDFKASNENYKMQLNALKKNENITVKDARDQRFALRKEHQAKMMGILTPEQQNKLAQLKNDREARRAVMGAKKMDKLKEKLNLSDEQVAKINAGRQAEHAQIKGIRDNNQLSRTEMKQQMIAVKTQGKDNFKSILTADQAAKMEAYKKESNNNKESK